MVTCRACLETNKEMRTFDEPFAIQYNLLTELKISVGDKMSQLICCGCWETVNYFMEFRTRCITSDSVMKNSILNFVKDEPDSTMITENCFNSEVKPELKEESMDSTAFNNIYDNDAFETCETFEIPLFSITNITSEANESKRFLRKRKIKKEPVIIENAVKREWQIEQMNKVKMNEPLKTEDTQTTKSKEAKIKRKLKIKQRAEEPKIKQLCGICSASFEDGKELFDHLEGHKKDVMCKLCFEKFTEWPEILGHRFKHTPENQKRCHMCNKYCASPANMELHYRKMHYDGSVKLKCHQCERSFDTPRNLRKHKWSVHSKKRFICDDCGESFNTKGKIKTHVLKHTTLKPHLCKLCGYSTKYVSGLREHTLRRHTPLRVYCSSCGSVFPCKEKLDQHTCKQKSRVCPICGVKMHKAASMYRHMKTHIDEKPFKCEECGVSYMSKVALQVHRDKHAGNRTKQCEHCPAKFYYASALIKHRRIHTGERPYVCKTCGRSFTGNSNLKVHRQIHGEYLINKKVKPEDITDYHSNKGI